MTEMWFDEALERARELDRIFAESGPVGAFHGLPFSIKNTFAVKGRRSDGAYVAWYDNIAEEDGQLVKIIRDQGAVLYCKTTNPQTAMHLETTSNRKSVCIATPKGHSSDYQQSIWPDPEPLQSRPYSWRLFGWRSGAVGHARLANWAGW